MGMTIEEAKDVIRQDMLVKAVTYNQDTKEYVEALTALVTATNKYQKIEEIVNDRYGKPVVKTLDEVIKVIEDGNDN